MKMLVSTMLLFLVIMLMEVGRGTCAGIAPGGFLLAPELPFDKLLDGMNFLKRYDYIHLDAGKADGNGLDMDMVKSAIEKFQVFHRLPSTGVIDPPTLAKMELPRCGCPDPEFSQTSERDEFRYGMEGGRWNKTELTFRVSRIPNGMSKKAVRRAVKEACRVWSNRSPLKFTEVRSGLADINIKFMGTMNHGDRRPFWHPLQEVAHSFPPTDPSLPGDVHLDASENYTFGEEEEEGGIDLFQLLVHQIGHTLGFGHSPHPESVMHPIVRPRDPEFGLTRNDMIGLHALYGRKNGRRSRHRRV